MKKKTKRTHEQNKNNNDKQITTRQKVHIKVNKYSQKQKK